MRGLEGKDGEEQGDMWQHVEADLLLIKNDTGKGPMLRTSIGLLSKETSRGHTKHLRVSENLHMQGPHMTQECYVNSRLLGSPSLAENITAHPWAKNI